MQPIMKAEPIEQADHRRKTASGNIKKPNNNFVLFTKQIVMVVDQLFCKNQQQLNCCRGNKKLERTASKSLSKDCKASKSVISHFYCISN